MLKGVIRENYFITTIRRTHYTEILFWAILKQLNNDSMPHVIKETSRVLHYVNDCITITPLQQFQQPVVTKNGDAVCNLREIMAFNWDQITSIMENTNTENSVMKHRPKFTNRLLFYYHQCQI